jgi:hypothetical protein
MHHPHHSRATLLLALSLAALALPACCKKPRNDTPIATSDLNRGCSKDNDCKGSRVCVSGQCVDPRPTTNTPATTVAQRPAQPQPAPQPQPIAQPQPADPYALGPDGLPVEIPPPGSKPPTPAEWGAVPREITVRHSTPLNCDTRMLREWLKVTCREKGGRAALSMEHISRSGQQAYLHNTPPQLVSVVVQVVRGKEYRARYTYQLGRDRGASDLIVSWPSGAPKPTIAFTNPP